MSMDEAWQGIAGDVMSLPDHLIVSRDGPTQEILGTSFRLDSLNSTLPVSRAPSLSYACGEFIWYMSGARTTEIIEAYAPSYKRFTNRMPIDPDGEWPEEAQDSCGIFSVAHGAYGHRWARVSKGGKNQIDHVRSILRGSPNSRQAVMTAFNFSDDLHHAEARDRNDIPCTISLQFLIRDNALHCVTCMRSSDLFLGLPYDVFCFTTLQRLLAEDLGVETGTFTLVSGSSHVYLRNEDKMTEALAKPPSMRGHNYKNPQFAGRKFWSTIRDAVFLESKARNGDLDVDEVFALLGEGTPLADIVLGCATKWHGHRIASHIHSEELRCLA